METNTSSPVAYQNGQDVPPRTFAAQASEIYRLAESCHRLLSEMEGQPMPDGKETVRPSSLSVSLSDAEASLQHLLERVRSLTGNIGAI